jgi:hypothetical protein
VSERFIGSETVGIVSPGVGGMVVVTRGMGRPDVLWSQLTLAGRSSPPSGPLLAGPLLARPLLAGPLLASPELASPAVASAALASAALEEPCRWDEEPGQPVKVLSGHRA